MFPASNGFPVQINLVWSLVLACCNFFLLTHELFFFDGDGNDKIE